MKKLIFCAILSILVLGILTLPDPLQPGFNNKMAEMDFNNLPDADLRLIAEQNWEAGFKETAISILDYIIENNMGDAASANVLREQYFNKIRSDNSTVGRLRSTAYGFSTGKVDDMSSLVGSSAADFIIYGDIRDMVRELVFEDEADEITIALSAAGIVTTLFPPGEGAITVAKALKKASAFSEPMINLMKKMLKGFKELSNISKVEKVKEIFMPFFHLAKQSKTWGVFITLMKYCQNLDQVKLLTKLLSLDPANGKKLSQILAVAGNQSVQISTQVLDHLGKYGQKGMDQFYSLLRKGPAGISFIAKHPTLAVRTLKNINKAYPLPIIFLQDKWNQFMLKYRSLAIATKYGSALLLMSFLVYQIVPFFSPKKIEGLSAGTSRKAVIAMAIAFGIVALLFFIINIHDAGPPIDRSQAISMDQSSLSPIGIQRSDSLTDIKFLVVVLMINIVVQGYCIKLAQRKTRQIQEQTIQAAIKLSLFENLDIYFDLPMYFGLAMTIFAFILITWLGAESARLWAYSSTLIGIGCTAYMRVNFLHKAKEAIINDIQAEDSQVAI